MNKCLPGNVDGCFCKDDCPSLSWFLSNLQCTSPDKVVLGQITNVSPFAKKFITAEITGPKLNMTTTHIQPGWEKTPMVIGTTVTRKNVTVFNAEENRIVEGEINLEENVIRDVPIPGLEINRETKTYDLLSGNEIIANSTIKLHGIDTLKS